MEGSSQKQAEMLVMLVNGWRMPGEEQGYEPPPYDSGDRDYVKHVPRFFCCSHVK